MFVIPMQVVGVIDRKGNSKETGKPYHLRLAQCVANIDGVATVFEMMLAEKIASPNPGVYDAHVVPFVDQEKRLRFRLASLVQAVRKAA